MPAAVLLLVGALLCFLGAVSIRAAVLAAGFGMAAMLAVAFNGSTSMVLIFGAVGAVGALVATLLLSKMLFFVSGVVVGSVVGVKLFVVISRGDPTWLLAVVFVPAVAVIFGFAAHRWQRPFVIWATALAGAALILSGVGRIATGFTGLFWRPESAWGATVFTLLWIALTLVGRNVQRRGVRGRRRSDQVDHPTG